MRHVIIGAGPAGITAAETLRQMDAACEIVLVGDEPEAPYGRMALPYLLQGAVDEAGLGLRPSPEHLHQLGVGFEQGRAAAVAPANHQVRLEDGRSLDYDRLLLACGARPVTPEIQGRDHEGVCTCWSLADARAIRKQIGPASKVVLVGAGFIGCTVLDALAHCSVELTVVELADDMLPRTLNATAAALVRGWCERRGVRVLTKTSVVAITAQSGSPPLRVSLDGSPDCEAHLVVLATGTRPAVDFLAGSGLAVESGVVADQHLCTSDPDVFVAGDAAQGPSLHGGGRSVHGVQPVAAEHGRVAGLNMAGRSVAYGGGLPMNLLDTLGLVSCTVGRTSGNGETDIAEALDRRTCRYLRLAFDGERLAGATTVGHEEILGPLRGLIQTGRDLGPWKGRLMQSPERAAEAFAACSFG